MPQYVIPIVAIVVLVVLGLFMMRIKNDTLTAAMVIFAGPVILALTSYEAGGFFGNSWGPVLRIMFLYTVIVLPGCLFFVFVALRKENLFNAYIANLERLGLLRRRKMDLVGQNSKIEGVETEWAFENRVRAYLDRFRSLYGRSVNEQNVLRQTLVRGCASKKMNDVDASPAQPMDDGGDAAIIVSGQRFEVFTIRTVLPVVFSTLLIAFGWCTVLPPLPDDYTGNGHNWAWALASPLRTPASFAFLGAYFFSLNMVVRRFMRRDLGPNAYNAISLRVVISVMIVWALEQSIDLTTIGAATQAMALTAAEKMLLSLAFVIGVFPYVGWSLLAAAVRKVNDRIPVIPNLTGTQPLSQLDGLTIWHESRLEEEDVENVPNMANADLPDLMLDTKMPPHRLIDWVDQAILLCAIDPDNEAVPLKNPSPKDADNSDAVNDRASMLWALKKSFNDAGIRRASALLEIFNPIAVPAGAPRGYIIYNEKAVAASDHPAIRVFKEPQLKQVCAIAAAVAQAPNIPMIRTWLAVDYKDWSPGDVIQLAAD